MSADEAQATSDEMSESAMESAQASTSDTFDDGELGDDETRAKRRGRIRVASTSRAAGISCLCAEIRRVIVGRRPCDHDELERLRSYLDKQLAHLQGIVARLANRLQRRLMAQQNRAWSSISRKASSTRRGCRAWSPIPIIRCRSCTRRKPPSATPW